MSAKKYKRPPIEEALCEFTFMPSAEGQQIDLTLPGRLLMNAAMKEYSGHARTQNLQTIATAPNNPSVAIHDAIFRIQLPTADGTRLVSVGANTLGITVLRPYEGWEAFKPRIQRALVAFSESTGGGLSPVTRIGVRYINRIVVPTANANPMSFLRGCPEEHEIFGVPVNSFMQRAEYIRPDGIKVIFTQATLQPVAPNTTEYLLDIDTLWDKEPLADQEQIIAMAQTLHDIEGAAFEDLITDDARNLFDAD
jgi:uncharacterized protein (TIGR04255 family)